MEPREEALDAQNSEISSVEIVTPAADATAEEVTETMPGYLCDRNIVYINLIFANEMQEQVQRPFEDF